MGDEAKTNLQRVLELAEAITVVGDNDYLEGTTTYRLGRLGDYCKSPAKQYNKNREKKRKEVVDKQNTLRKGNVGATEEKKEENNREINKLNEEFNDAIESLLDQDETIKIPIFKLSEFIAKEDRKVIQKVSAAPGQEARDVEVTIKAGQALVPVRFFALMGDAIDDDKNSLTYKQS